MFGQERYAYCCASLGEVYGAYHRKVQQKFEKKYRTFKELWKNDKNIFYLPRQVTNTVLKFLENQGFFQNSI